MNCKPGDLARIVARDASIAPHVGKIVRCIRRYDYRGHWPGWVVEPKIGDHDCIADVVLRPIADPGDDAVDESLLWLPVPVKETA